MSRMPRLPPEIVASLLQELEDLGLGCDEEKATSFWAKHHIFPQPNKSLAAELAMKAGTRIDQCLLLPQLPETAPFPVPRPRPDLLYGYPIKTFTKTQFKTLVSLYLGDTPHQPLLPFLVIKYKTGASLRGNL